MRLVTKTDRFGNRIEGEIPYARGRIISSTEDDYRKLGKAHSLIRNRLEKGQRVFNFTGLERGYPPATDDISSLYDETAPALYAEEFRKVAMQHLGASPAVHDVFLTNRLTAATVATILSLTKSGQTVVGVSPSYSHPTVIRAVNLVGAKFTGTTGSKQFSMALDSEKNIGLVVVTRLAVTYDILDINDLKTIIRNARDHKLPIFMDDAGGARVGPAIFGQPKSLELDVDVAATGLDKYGTKGPRLGLLGGKKELIAKIASKAWELGLEARPIFLPAAVRTLQLYDPERVRTLVRTTKDFGNELKKVLGTRVHETPVTAQVLAEDLLEVIMQRAGLSEPPSVPYEATAAVAMSLLQDYGIITVHFAGVPPGTSALLFKFIDPITLEEFGCAEKLAHAIDSSISSVAKLISQPKGLQRLLFDIG